MNDLDEVDRQILAALQQNGRISNVELAQTINLSAPATHARVKRLTDQGYIRQYTTLLDKKKLGYDITCFISVSLQLHQQEGLEAFRARVSQMPEVLECHHVTGEFDYLLKVLIRDRQDLERFVVKGLTPIPGVARIHTSLVLSEVKSTTMLPVVTQFPTGEAQP
ncbi:MAG: Lrp/AsnC family transcriptional regulator [Chloroflexi bacterium]|nr:Lrp/AsnC family transcriptional regulator [Chloroflexota bacterium]